MLACGGCVANAMVSSLTSDWRLIIGASGILGGWAAFALVLRPCNLAGHMQSLWGIPRFRLTDFVSLSFLLAWPLLIIRQANESAISNVYVSEPDPMGPQLACWLALLGCLSFLWLRGLWILQKYKVESFARRTLFLAGILPLLIVFALVMGSWIFVASIMLAYGMILEAIVLSFPFGIVGAFVLCLVRGGFAFALGQPIFDKVHTRPGDLPPTPCPTPPNSAHRQVEHCQST